MFSEITEFGWLYIRIFVYQLPRNNDDIALSLEKIYLPRRPVVFVLKLYIYMCVCGCMCVWCMCVCVYIYIVLYIYIYIRGTRYALFRYTAGRSFNRFDEGRWSTTTERDQRKGV